MLVHHFGVLARQGVGFAQNLIEFPGFPGFLELFHFIAEFIEKADTFTFCQGKGFNVLEHVFHRLETEKYL